ncbi:MAG: ATP-binding protein [Christensenellales bacterium]
MKAKSKADRLSVRLVHMEILLALALLGVVFLTAAHSDTVSARQQMATTIRYIQEQCNRYNRIELASETKSLMRVMESVDHIARQMAADGEESAPLSEYAQMGYVSGLIVMDETGFVLSDYHGTGEAPRQLGEYLDSPALLDAALYPEKRYATRFACADGSMIDLAAVGRRMRRASSRRITERRWNISCVSAVHRADAFGYSPETSGTIVVTGGSRVVASNDETLIGGNAEEMAILRQIRQAYSSGELVRASWPEDSFRRYYGMMGCGRNFYVYVYMPEKTVFATTPQSMLFALIFYAVVLAFAKAVRFRTAQSYQERQYRVQKEYAEKLRAANAELSAAVDQADRANAAKTSFLSRMSHDIRTPLNGIIGLLQIDDAHPSDVALLTANREKMKVAANHLLSLINDVLQMSKLESGEITLAHEPLDLNRLLRDILTIVEQRAAEAGVALEYDRRQFERMKPDCVYGSPLHLRQVFLNVYGNCIKYNKVGGSVTTLCQNVSERDGIVTYRWVIRDTGIGMSEAFLAHIFDPFSQEHIDARSMYHGTGLGMSIVKSLIDKMGGSIEVSSREGEGSEFVITLPFEMADAVPEAQEQAELEKKADVRGLHLLLAEDNELNADIIRTLLADYGITTDTAQDGRKALELFESHVPGTYAGILMDMMMPNMDGVSATRAIRALARADAKTIPIIAMTANAFDEDAKACFEAGMNAHLAKPFQMEKVVAVIAQFCRKA